MSGLLAVLPLAVVMVAGPQISTRLADPTVDDAVIVEDFWPA